jgi:AraC-like DNA-binding protein
MRTLFFDRTVIAPVDGCAIVEVSDLLRELILSMLNEPHAYSEQGRGSHLAALIQDELRFSRKLPLHLPFPKEPRLRRVCEAMQKRPTLRIDLEMWAAEFSVSGRTLARLFRKELNMSFMEWRMQSLLLEAHLRLAQGQKSSRIAQALGYENHAAFCAMFKRQLGTTPSQHLLGGAFDGSPTLLIEGARHGNSYLRHLSSPK